MVSKSNRSPQLASPGARISLYYTAIIKDKKILLKNYASDIDSTVNVLLIQQVTSKFV